MAIAQTAITRLQSLHLHKSAKSAITNHQDGIGPLRKELQDVYHSLYKQKRQSHGNCQPLFFREGGRISLEQFKQPKRKNY
jgi:hypothetical protein